MDKSFSFPLLLLLCGAALPSTSEVTDTGVLINGDVIIGGLFPVSRDNCSVIDSQYGIQRMETMVFSLMQANADQGLLKYGKHKIRLGALLFDTCSSSEVVKLRVVELLKSSFSAESVCKAPDGSLIPATRTGGGATSGHIIGVVGASSSYVTIQAARMLMAFSVPLISYASVSSDLSDRNRFELFARTVPPGIDQAVTLAELAAHFNWTYVLVVFSLDYDENRNVFVHTVSNLGVCIAVQLVVKFDAGQLELDQIVHKMLIQSRARVVVLFTREDHTRMLLAAASRARVPSGRFIWLAGDGSSSALGSGSSAITMGSLVINTATSETPGFTKYFTSLRPEVQRRTEVGGVGFTNKYFDQFWQQHFNCSLGKGNRTAQSDDSLKNKCNSGGYKMLPDHFQPDTKVQNVYDAVYTYVHGLDKVIKQACLSQDPDSDTKVSGMFDQCVRNVSQFPSNQLYKIMMERNNSFTNNLGHKVEFTANGDRVATYLISSYQKDAGTQQVVRRVIGRWTKRDGLTLSEDQRIVWPDGSDKPPVSVCSDECEPGQRKMFGRSRCCWACVG